MTLPADPVRQAVADAVDAGRAPGAVWWVERGGVPVSHGAAGAAATEPERDAAAEDTVYDLASLTKPLSTALLAALLEGEGALELDQACGRFLPELRRSPWSEVTLLELGTHRSGLPAWEPLYLSGTGRRSYLRAIAALAPTTTRGQVLYSDLGYIALGIAVERAAGRPLDVLFRERVATVLGLARTGFAVGDGPWARAAPTERGNAYERRLAGSRAGGARFRDHLLRGEVHDGNAFGLGGVAGHAGLFGTAEEVARIARAILSAAPNLAGLTSGARARLLSEQPAGSGRTFGFVTAAGSTAAAGVLPPTAPGHVGFTGTSIWLLPGIDAVVVLLTNRVHPEVEDVDFQPVRLAFHRAAAGLLASAPGAPSA